MPLSLDLDNLYPIKELKSDCQNDPTEWGEIGEHQEEFDKLMEPFKGLPSPYVVIDENENYVNVPYIENVGIKKCLRYPNKKCVYLKSKFCDDVYSRGKDEDEALDESFVGILDHKFYESRRKNNPFARKSPSRIRTTRKLLNPLTRSTELLVPISTPVSTLKSTAATVKKLLPHISPKKSAELNKLVRDMSRMTLRNKSSSTLANKSPSKRTTLRNSRSSSTFANKPLNRIVESPSKRMSRSRVRSPIRTRSRVRSQSHNKTVKN